MPIEAGLLSATTMLFNSPITGLLPQMNMDPINVKYDDIHYMALEACQRKYVHSSNDQ